MLMGSGGCVSVLNFRRTLPLNFIHVPVVYNTGLCERLRFQKNLGLLIMSMCLSCIIQGYVSVLISEESWPLNFIHVPVVYNTGLCERLKFQKNLDLFILSMCLSCKLLGYVSVLISEEPCLLILSMCLSCNIQGYVSVLDFRRTSTS